MTERGDVYEQLVDAANAIYGRHPHVRAVHAKGTWCAGTFTPTPEAAKLTRATLFQGDPVPALIRFSNAGGDPESDDAGREARGMAVKLRPVEGEEMDMLGTTNPAFATRTPEEFLELLQLRAPDPETGQPDMAKLGAFLAAHPESQPAIQATIGAEPPASFAQLAFRSPHSFKFLNADGEETWLRYRWRPEAGEARFPDY
jgi:catalase